MTKISNIQYWLSLLIVWLFRRTRFVLRYVLFPSFRIYHLSFLFFYLFFFYCSPHERYLYSANCYSLIRSLYTVSPSLFIGVQFTTEQSCSQILCPFSHSRSYPNLIIHSSNCCMWCRSYKVSWPA